MDSQLHKSLLYFTILIKFLNEIKLMTMPLNFNRDGIKRGRDFFELAKCPSRN